MYPLSKWEGGEIAEGGGGLVWCESIKICVTMSGAHLSQMSHVL